MLHDSWSMQILLYVLGVVSYFKAHKQVKPSSAKQKVAWLLLCIVASLF